MESKHTWKVKDSILLKNAAFNSIHLLGLNPSPTKYISTPYYPEITNKLSKVLKKHKIQLITNSNIYKLRNRVQSTKNEVPSLNKSGIYQISCGSRGCNYNYIGQSRWAIKNRFVEHLPAYKNNHLETIGHRFFDENDQKRR
jgi:predicted small metal-binding protein